MTEIPKRPTLAKLHRELAACYGVGTVIGVMIGSSTWTASVGLSLLTFLAAAAMAGQGLWTYRQSKQPWAQEVLMRQIYGQCPACGNRTLFLGTDGWIICDWNAQNSSMDRAPCPNPGAANALLNGGIDAGATDQS